MTPLFSHSRCASVSIAATICVGLILIRMDDEKSVFFASPAVVASSIRSVVLLARACSPRCAFRCSTPLTAALTTLMFLVALYGVLLSSHFPRLVYAQDSSVNALRALRFVVLVSDALGTGICAVKVLQETRLTRRPHVTTGAFASDTPLNVDAFVSRTFAWETSDCASTLKRDCGFESKCCFCLDDFRAADIIAELECNHCFHRSCLEAWVGSLLARRSRQVCPFRCSAPARHKTCGDAFVHDLPGGERDVLV
eukprot:TRINITY_DN60919_c0_g1_i1.p1 TRINITY_DN60919_c0_g1~~TRINITY_DN60919_c0_g1_i1.p1  ORF type:complete len:276 (+),score=21.21 TRINITY_DN60919_c0_g1_i1:67-828(+)